MPRPNRVTPLGEIIAVPDRGTFTGNRGCLHDAEGTIRRPWHLERWGCVLPNLLAAHSTERHIHRHEVTTDLDAPRVLPADSVPPRLTTWAPVRGIPALPQCSIGGDGLIVVPVLIVSERRTRLIVGDSGPTASAESQALAQFVARPLPTPDITFIHPCALHAHSTDRESRTASAEISRLVDQLRGPADALLEESSIP